MKLLLLGRKHKKQSCSFFSPPPLSFPFHIIIHRLIYLFLRDEWMNQWQNLFFFVLCTDHWPITGLFFILTLHLSFSQVLHRFDIMSFHSEEFFPTEGAYEGFNAREFLGKTPLSMKLFFFTQPNSLMILCIHYHRSFHPETRNSYQFMLLKTS